MVKDMTKYYYNNELIRTSKSHNNYTHAVIKERNGKVEVLACCSSKELASKQWNSMYNYAYGSEINNLEKKIKAIENGRTYYYRKERRSEFKVEIKETLEEAKAKLENYRKYAKEFIEQVSVVEIEAR